MSVTVLKLRGALRFGVVNQSTRLAVLARRIATVLRCAATVAAFDCSLAAIPGWAADCAIQLRDVTAKTGVQFRHTDGGGGKFYIVEYISCGVATFDYDNDGDIDIYFLNGAPLRGTKMDYVPRNALYRNDGGWHFTDVTEQAGVGDTGCGLGVAVADYDNDGDADIYVNNFGPNVLYRNNGNGTFTNVAAAAHVADGDKVGAGVSFLDVNRDGLLDLYVANYVQFTYESHHVHTRFGVPAYPSPLEYDGEPDTLYVNCGDGTYADRSKESGIAAYAGTGMGMTCCDFDNDGDTDVLVGNDVLPNFLFQNDGRGKFTEIGIQSGVALDVSGIPYGSMAVASGDYDNDGLLDFFVTSYANELSTLYRNLGEGIFNDATRSSGAGKSTLSKVTWGTGLVDFDNDGDRDIFIACGNFDPNVERRDDTAVYKTRNVLLMNTGTGKFVDVSRRAGTGMAVRASSRGAAFDDFDNDGDIDVVVVNSRERPTILENVSALDNHWLQIRLRGTASNRDGVGSRVEVTTGDRVSVDEVHSGRSYQSHFGSRLHFGLGKAGHVDRIAVRWISGKVDTLTNVSSDQLIEFVEGTSQK